MPGVGTVIAAIVSVGKAAYAAIAAYKLGAIAIGYLKYAAVNYIYKKLTEKDQPNRTYDVNSRKKMVKVANGPRTHLYGTTWIGSNIISAMQVLSHHNFICVITDHPCEAILDIELDNEPFFTADEIKHLQDNGYISPAQNVGGGISKLRSEVNANRAALKGSYNRQNFIYGESCFLGVSLGGAGDCQVKCRQWRDIFTPRIGRSPTLNWFCNNAQTPAGELAQDPSFRVDGASWFYWGQLRTPSAAITAENARPVWGHFPQISMKVRRGNSTLMLPSENGVPVKPGDFIEGNSALCAYDLLKRTTEYRESLFGIPRLDDASFIAAAKVCNDKKYTANGVWEATGSPASIVEEICDTMLGHIIERNGIRYCYAGVSTAPTKTIRQKDVADDTIRVQVGALISQRTASLDVQYMDTDGQLQSARVRRAGQLTHTDTITMTMPCANNADTAGLFGQVQLRRMWDNRRVAFTLINSDVLPAVWDRVILDMDEFGLDGRYRVYDITKRPDGGFDINCEEEPDDFYDRQDDSSYKPPAKPTPSDGVDHLLVTGAGGGLIVHSDGGLLRI